jgi:hypothetical protein
MSFEILERIFGTNDKNKNINNDSVSNFGVMPMYSLRQGRAYLNDEEKLNENDKTNVYLAQKSNNIGNRMIKKMNKYGKGKEGFESADNNATTYAGHADAGHADAATASASASSAPAQIPTNATDDANVQKLDDAFDSKMNAYSNALSEYNKEILTNNNYFVVQVKTLTPINSCFNCDASLGGTGCSAMGVSNSNGDIRLAAPDSTSPTANLLPCVHAGVTVPGWSANPNDSNSCIAPLAGQKCCPTTIFNGQPVCIAGFGNYDENAMNSWMGSCISPPSPDEINQKIALANEYCQGNGIDLNYWSKNANNFTLVTVQDPANNIRPFAKMNSVPVWIVNTFTTLQDANKAKNTLVFSPTVQSALKSTREDMLNAGTALIKAISSKQVTTAADRKMIEQKLQTIKTKMSKLDSQARDMTAGNDDDATPSSSHHDKTKTSNNNNNSNTKESFEVRSAIPTSLIAQEEDTRIQFKSNYAYYTLWFIIAVLLMIVMFSNFFYDKGGNGESGSSSEEGESSSSSYMLGFGIISILLFIYFIIQFVLAHFNVSRPQLPFESINPLFVFNQ